MEQHIAHTLQTRNNVLQLISGLNTVELNTIPEGFKNNLAWNIGHLVVTQQLLCYGLAQQPMKVDAAIIDKYRKGSAPESEIEESEIAQLKSWLTELPPLLLKDVSTSNFSAFKTYTTSYGITLNSVEDAVVFNAQHEAMHLGYIMAMLKSIKS